MQVLASGSHVGKDGSDYHVARPTFPASATAKDLLREEAGRQIPTPARRDIVGF